MNCISLYTGCGGLDLGFHREGFKTVWANDIDGDAIKTYLGELDRLGVSHPENKVGDITSVNVPHKFDISVVIGGPPCQGFSVAGKMDPNDPRSKHVWKFFDVVRKIQPRAFVMENVKSLSHNKRWSETIEKLKNKALTLKYNPYLMLLNSADYGVPQSRERMFLVGIRNAGIFQHPNPTTDKHITVREALKSLPDYGMPGNDSICRAKITFARNPVIRKSPFAGMLFNGQGRPIDLDATCQTLPASMGGNRTPIIDQRSLTCNEEPWIVKYHAKLVDGIQDNLTVPTFLRRLTVEEASLLQGFPIGMKFYGSQCSKFRQIGNSVPPALGAAVAKKIKQALLLYDNKVKVQHVQRIGLI